MNELTVGIVSVPFDLGIKLIKGRVGARFAPPKIKKEFYKLAKREKSFKNIKIIDYGNIVPIDKNVKKTHERVTKVLKKIIKNNVIPIVIGGGHDISFGSVKAAARIYKKIGEINIDAHFDVRPVVDGKITSGTPFRRLLEGGFLNGKNFVELGVHSPKNLKEHYQYIVNKKGTLIKLNFINKAGIEKALNKAFKIAKKNTNAIIFDIDIDAIQKRFAPGCSAPSVKGFTKDQILQAAFVAGKNKSVKLFNLMEVSPVYDIHNKTVKLAAKLILSFINGVNQRKIQ